jgi:hypothetical protein
MNAIPVEILETAVLGRNPLLGKKLQPGLPESKIRRMLSRAKLLGDIQCLVDLYMWKNGTILDPEMADSKTGFFPAPIYHFIELDRAIGDLGFFKEAAVNYPALSEAVGRYFPIFWNGSKSWLAVDLKPSCRNRIIHVVDCRSDQPFREAYHSFEEFINDVIKANDENIPLAGLRRD